MVGQELALLVPGGHGQLGTDLALAATGPVRAPSSGELDVTDPAAVDTMGGALAVAAKEADFAPVVINAAAYTAVDAAETDHARAFAVNETGPKLLAQSCAEHRVALLHVSTDYVFSGDGDRPYLATDDVAPRSVYGESKLAGERAVLASGARAWVVRTAWVYGARGRNFVKTMVRLESERQNLSVVDDQHGSPTWSADLAAGLLELARSVVDGHGPRQRVLHATGGGETTWCGLARAVFSALGADPERVRACGSREFPRPAPRPSYSVLSAREWREAGLTPLRPWRAALAAFFAEHGRDLRAH